MSTTRGEGDGKDGFGVGSKDSKTRKGGDVPESHGLIERGTVDGQRNRGGVSGEEKRGESGDEGRDVRCEDGDRGRASDRRRSESESVDLLVMASKN